MRWILYQKDEVSEERKPLLQVKWQSLAICSLGWNSSGFLKTATTSFSTVNRPMRSHYCVSLFSLLISHIKLAWYFPWRRKYFLLQNWTQTRTDFRIILKKSKTLDFFQGFYQLILFLNSYLLYRSIWVRRDKTNVYIHIKILFQLVPSPQKTLCFKIFFIIILEWC